MRICMRFQLLILALAFLTPIAHAQETQKAQSGDIDDEITNARLRAVTGSKSPFSFWSQFIYYGAAISNPFSTQRPQLNSQNNADPTTLVGQISGKYRFTEHDSVIAGIGVQYTPAYTDNTNPNKLPQQTCILPMSTMTARLSSGEFKTSST
jgi:hypothetical protein